jgi:uncharacterized protein
MNEVRGFRQAIEEYVRREARPVEKFGHQPRLYALATQIGEGQSYDDDVVFAAAWLHDIGVFVGHRPEEPELLARWDNVIYAVERAPSLLEAFGFPQEKIAPVVEAIRTHQPSGEPATIEATIVRDADILEQLGSIGVLRTVCKIGRDSRFQIFTDAVNSLRKGLQTLPGQIRLDRARALAHPRIEALEAFLRAVDREALPALF